MFVLVRTARQGRFIGNPLGLNGHDSCISASEFGGETRVGQCYNEIECIASGGVPSGYCSYGPGANILVSIN